MCRVVTRPAIEWVVGWVSVVWTAAGRAGAWPTTTTVGGGGGGGYINAGAPCAPRCWTMAVLHDVVLAVASLLLLSASWATAGAHAQEPFVASYGPPVRQPPPPDSSGAHLAALALAPQQQQHPFAPSPRDLFLDALEQSRGAGAGAAWVASPPHFVVHTHSQQPLLAAPALAPAPHPLPPQPPSAGAGLHNPHTFHSVVNYGHINLHHGDHFEPHHNGGATNKEEGEEEDEEKAAKAEVLLPLKRAQGLLSKLQQLASLGSLDAAHFNSLDVGDPAEGDQHKDSPADDVMEPPK